MGVPKGSEIGLPAVGTMERTGANDGRREGRGIPDGTSECVEGRDEGLELTGPSEGMVEGEDTGTARDGTGVGIQVGN